MTHIWSATSDLASGVEDPPTRRGLIVEWQQQPDFAEPPLSIEGAADHWNHRQDEDYYSQPGLLFRLMTAEQKKALFENTAHAMSDAPKEIKVRHNGNCLKADPAYGEGVAKALARIIHEASTARVDQADLTGFLGLWTLRRGV